MNYYNKVIDLPGEIWKPVPIEGFEGYSVSNKGRVKREMIEKFFLKDKSVRLFPEMLIKQRVGNNGYLKVNLYSGDKTLTRSVQRLVGLAFVENPNHYSQLNHKDENPLNNDAENLEWVSPKQNSNYGTRTERMRQAVSILNARKEAKRLYPKLPSYEIIKILPMPKNSFLSILNLMNYMYNSIENKMKHYTNWEEIFLSNTDEVLYDIYIKQKSVIGIGMTKWLCVIAALKQPDLIDKSCIKEFCDNSYLKYFFSTDISILPEFSLLKDIENKYKIDNTYIVDSQLPCGETLFINGYCI